MPASSETPFEYLLALEGQWGPNTLAVPYQIKTEPTWGGILFLSGDQPLLVPMEEVVEILHVQSLAPIPGVKSWLLGLTTSRGEIFPVTDLFALFHQQAVSFTPSVRIMVVSYREEYFGILVSRVIGLQRFTTDKKMPKNPSFSSEYDPFIIGTYVNGETEYPIISLRALIQHPRFRDVARRDDNLVQYEE